MNQTVTEFIEGQNHPLQAEINHLRNLITTLNLDMSENIKWNGPNYMHKGLDRITMKINPHKHIQLILHRGAKVLEQPKEKLITSKSSFLNWKTNDRAVISLNSLEEIKQNETELVSCLNKWIIATTE
jgi:hypothetical protein